MMRYGSVVVVFLLLSAPSTVAAQALVPMRPVRAQSAALDALRQRKAVLEADKALNAQRDESDSTKATAAKLNQDLADVNEAIDDEQDSAPKGADFLQQGGFNFGTGPSELTLQAADLFFSRNFRFFLRSTVPLTTDDDSQPAGTTPTIDDNIREALAHPYAGLMYASLGFLPRIPTGANSISLGSLEKQYGLFADFRFGFKAVELPASTGTGTTARLKHDVTPFVTSNAGLRLQLPLFNDPDAANKAGDFGLAVLWVSNWATDATVSQLFSGTTPQLEKSTRAVHLSAAVVLSEIAYLSLEGTAWSSSTLGKKWMLGINLLRN